MKKLALIILAALTLILAGCSSDWETFESETFTFKYPNKIEGIFVYLQDSPPIETADVYFRGKNRIDFMYEATIRWLFFDDNNGDQWSIGSHSEDDLRIISERYEQIANTVRLK